MYDQSGVRSGSYTAAMKARKKNEMNYNTLHVELTSVHVEGGGQQLNDAEKSREKEGGWWIPSNREHRIFLALVAFLVFIILVLGLGQFEATDRFIEEYNVTSNFFKLKPTTICEEITSLDWDKSFSCPDPVAQLKTLCVNEVSQCPTVMSCNASGVANGTLCWDGTCTEEECSEEDYSPCDCGVPCLITKLTVQEYADVLASMSEDAAVEDCSEPPDFNFSGQLGFVSWIAIAAGALFVWCAVSQRLIGRSMEPARVVVDKDNFSLQTGYNFSFIGYALYWTILLTVGYIHFCLVLLTVSYYNIDEGIGMWFFDKDDDRRVLRAFEIVWMVGAAYTVVLQWPKELKLHFMLRAPLTRSNYVRVWFTTPEIVLSSNSNMQKFQAIGRWIDYVFNLFFAFLYSDVTLPSNIKGSWTVCPVSLTDDGQRVITYQLRVLVFDEASGAFVPLPPDVPITIPELVAKGLGEGIAPAHVARIRSRVGSNTIDVARPEIFATLVEEFTKPFYTYQMFMAWTWFNFSYWHMGVVYMIAFAISGLIVAKTTYTNRFLLYKLVAGSNIFVQVKRGSEFVKVPTEDLVPGDVIAVDNGPCVADMVLVAGQAVLDESSLTGESMPVHKVALDVTNGNVPYNGRDHKASTLRAGTIVLQGTDQLLETPTTIAVVLSTGCQTMKGQRVSDILFRIPPLFKFDVQVKFVLIILIIYGIIMFCITLKFLEEDPTYAWFYAIYVLATSMPPLLPSVFVVSVGIGAARLAKNGVLCSDPNRLLVAGKVRVCCFDKTGTLTTSGMAFHGVCPVSSFGDPGDHMNWVEKGSIFEQAMASCHTLSKLDDGSLIGAAVDVIMFEATHWSLSQTDQGNIVTSPAGKLLQVLRRFDFDHHSMTSSVVVKDPSTGIHTVFVKGSAESVARCLAKQNEAVMRAADEYSRQGCYTLAVGTRTLSTKEVEDVMTLARAQVENDIALVGLLTFRNELKPDSVDAIAMLNEGACRSVMVTGDHILTAVFIAKQVGMLRKDAVVLRSTCFGAGKIDLPSLQWVDESDAPIKLDLATPNLELVILGNVWRQLTPEEKNKLLPFTRVWARANPSDKVDVVNIFISNDFVTSMCGDGGNDCGALRAAHVGIALSDSDASIVSPFTSVNKTCMSVPQVLLEGRASLASALSSYKYMIAYGQVETMNQVINAWYSITFGEWCWVFMDGFWLVTLAYTLAFSKPSKKLSTMRPTSSLLGTYTVASVVGLVMIHFCFLAIALGALNAQDWYKCRTWDPATADIASLFAVGDNYESSVIFLVSGAQYLSSSMAFNFGHKHREPWLYNRSLMVLLIIFFAIHLTVLFYPSKLSCLFRVNCQNEDSVGRVLSGCRDKISNDWNTTVMPMDFRVTLFLIILFNTLAAVAWEMLLVVGPLGRFFRTHFPQRRPLNL